MFQILLAAPSIIYAPVYIAKYLCLSKWFAQTEIVYPESNKLIDDLLRVGTEARAILAVADPMRILFSQEVQSDDTHSYESPLVIGSLIQKKLIWGIKDFPTESYINGSNRYKIVTHPERMTAFTLVFNKLYSTAYGEDISNDDTRNNKLDKVIFSEIHPGEESTWENSVRKWSKKLRCSYVTMDPLEWLVASRLGKDLKTYRFIDDDPVEMIFTGLITGDETYKRYKDVIDDLLHGIKRGIKYINENKILSQQTLMKYEDSKFNLSVMGWSEKDVFQFVDMLIQEKVYESQLQVCYCKLLNSIKEWKYFFERRKTTKYNSASLLKKLNSEDFFNLFKYDQPNQEVQLDSDAYKQVIVMEKAPSRGSQKVKELFDYAEYRLFQISIILTGFWFANYIYVLLFGTLFDVSPTPIFGALIFFGLLLTILKVLLEDKNLKFSRALTAVIIFLFANGSFWDYGAKFWDFDHHLEGDLIVGVALVVILPFLVFIKKYNFQIDRFWDSFLLRLRKIKYWVLQLNSWRPFHGSD